MADNIVGLSIGLGLDTAGIDLGMKQLKGKLALVNSEMKANMSAFDRGEKSVDKYNTQLTGLNRKLDVQKSSVNSARTEYERMVAQHGEGSVQADKAATAYNNETAALNNLERHVEGLTEEFRTFQREQELANSGFGRLSSSLDEMGSKLSAVGSKMTSAGKGLSVGLTAPILAFGAAGIAAFNDVDEAIDTVITKTGASGDAAEGLTESFRAVAKRVPDDLLSVGEAIGEVNTQFGFLGTELEDASQLMLQFASINGTDVTSSSIAAKKAIEAYGLANSDLDSVLDAVTKTAQDTGQSVDDLFDKATKGAPQIKALGLTFADGTALLGSFEKAGVDSGAALSSMSKAQVLYAKSGKTLEEGLNGTIKSILGAKTETEALTTAAEVFGTKGGPRMVDAIKRGTFNLDEFTGAGEKAAGTVKNTFEETVDPIDQAAIALNNAKLAMGEVGEVVQVALLPFMEKATEVLGNLADRFRELSPEAKQTILVVAGIAAAIGPALVVVGYLTSALGAVFTAMGTVSAAVAVVSTGIASTVPAVSALAGVFTLLTGPVGLAIAAVALLGGGLIALDQHMDKPIVKSDIFAGKISEATKKAVGSYMDLNTEATAELNALAWSQGEITDKAAASLTEKYRQMGDMVLTAMKEKHAEQLAAQQKMFDDSDVLTQEQEQKQMQKLKETQLREQENHTKSQARIIEIIALANKEKRANTTAEIAEIAKLEEAGKKKAIETLSKSQEEQKTILKNMKEQKGVIRAEEAATAVKISIDQKEKVVAEAQKAFKETVKTARESAATNGGISQADANAIIKEAERKKNETVNKAKGMHADVIIAAKAQSGDHVKEVNWETGKVLSGWDRMYNGVIKAVNWITSLFGGKQFKVKGSVAAYGKPDAEMKARYAKGTMHGTHPGGPAIVGEEGPELAHIPGMGTTIVGRRGPELLGNLPRGSAVLPNKQTESMLKQYGFPGYADGVGNWGVFDFIEKGASGAWNYLKGKFGVSDSLLPDGFLKEMGTSVTSSFKGMATDFIKDLFSKSDAGGNGPVSFGNLTKTSSFGNRFHPIFKKWKLHAGDDYAGKIGTAIKATTGGKVTSSGASGTGFGTMVKINNGAFDYIYAHLSRAFARIGASVGKGDVIGALGSTGDSTGPHLHYEVRKNGVPVKPGGYKDGGLITKEQLAWVGEGGHEEVIIPVGDPRKRTNAMKLLALAGKKLGVDGSNNGNVSPSQMQSPSWGNGNNNQVVSLLQELISLMKNPNPQPMINQMVVDGRVIAEVIVDDVSQLLGGKTNMEMLMKGLK